MKFLGSGQSLEESIRRGEDLAYADDCVASHARHGGPPFVDGFPIVAPSARSIPQHHARHATGIGNWSADDITECSIRDARVMASVLYPAMPFPAYTKVARQASPMPCLRT